jgi:hypothetical protein
MDLWARPQMASVAKAPGGMGSVSAMAGCVGVFRDSQHQPGAYTLTGGTLCRFSLAEAKSSPQVRMGATTFPPPHSYHRHHHQHASSLP